MSAAKHLIFAAVLIGGAGTIGHALISKKPAPIAMLRYLQHEFVCVQDQIIYGNLRIDCRSPIAYFDIRKLDMRSDNRSRSIANSGRRMASPP